MFMIADDILRQSQFRFTPGLCSQPRKDAVMFGCYTEAVVAGAVKGGGDDHLGDPVGDDTGQRPAGSVDDTGHDAAGEALMIDALVLSGGALERERFPGLS